MESGVSQDVSKPNQTQVDAQPAPQSEAGLMSAWSPAAMIDRLDGDEELARQLVTLFLGEYPRLMDSLRVSVSGGNPDAVRRAAHAAKGCIANFVDGGPQMTAYRIEQLGTAGTLADVPALVAQLECEVEGLARAMTVFQESSCAS